MNQQREIPIWFFIGILLTAYGVLIFATGIYYLICPPAKPLVLAYLHPDIWWGILLLVVGLIYLIKFRPSKQQNNQ